MVNVVKAEKVLFLIPELKITVKHFFFMLFICASALFFFTMKSFFIKESETQYTSLQNIQSADIDAAIDAILLASNSTNIHGNDDFESITNNINEEIVGFITNQLNLSEKEADLVLNDYYESRSVVIDQIHEVMVSSREVSGKKTETVYKNYDAVNDFVEALSGHACNFASLPVFSRLKTISTTDTVKTVAEAAALRLPCKIILTEVLHPVANYLREKAIIKDVNVVKIDLEKQLRSSILNLGTARDVYFFSVSDTWRKKVWKFTSETTMKASVKADVKTGFDLSKYFNIIIDHSKRKMVIDLPSPRVLSNEVYVNFGDIDEGLFAPGANSKMYNTLSYLAKQEAERYAENYRLKDAAKRNAHKAILNIFEPMMSLPQFNYTVTVAFDGEPSFIYTDRIKE